MPGGAGVARDSAGPDGSRGRCHDAQLSRLCWLASDGGWNDQGCVVLSVDPVVPAGGRRQGARGWSGGGRAWTGVRGVVAAAGGRGAADPGGAGGGGGPQPAVGQ